VRSLWSTTSSLLNQNLQGLFLVSRRFKIKMAALATTLPKEISKLGQEVKLFGKWDTQEWVAISLLVFIANDFHLQC